RGLPGPVEWRLELPLAAGPDGSAHQRARRHDLRLEAYRPLDAEAGVGRPERLPLRLPLRAPDLRRDGRAYVDELDGARVQDDQAAPRRWHQGRAVYPEGPRRTGSGRR